MTTRAILYARTASRGSGASMDVQIKHLKGYAEARGWANTLAVDVGAATTGPGLILALEAIETGAANVLLATDPSRVSRDLQTLNRAIERVEAVGGRLVFTSLGDLGHGPERTLLLTWLAAARELDADMRSRVAAEAWRRRHAISKAPLL